MVGTVHEAETFQLPQSIRPVLLLVRQFGCDCGSDTEGWMFEAMRRAPSPP